MTISQLDSKTALIVIDLQEGIVPLAPEAEAKTAVEHSVQLINAFHAKKLPVVLVNVEGGAPGRTSFPHTGGEEVPTNWSDFIPALPRKDDDIVVTKHCWGALINTDLHTQLKQQGVTQVVVVGIATSMGVESTARQAYELGYNVTLVEDAMADLSFTNHRHAVDNIFPMIAEVGSTSDLIKILNA
ncbi:isochorismatase family protein [Vibrio zhugei]|uniref:Isochorismatase family protein n=1 Tax=Vibrio zhugei TaxID=2479546 RepID=A0ABV7CC94_9VIBR|nr:isochorismatase family protein [Vibrio zhugei]